MPQAAIELLCVGTELLADHVNTHESYIGRRLRESGLALSRALTMPDDRSALTRAIAESLRRCDVLITSGGLGPTFDDITREAVAGALRRKLVFKPKLWAQIERRLSARHSPVPEENKRQALVIEGAQVLANDNGSAPGQLLRIARGGRAQLVALLPGPYRELSPMFERLLLPRLAREHAKGLHARSVAFRIAGLPESVADEKLAQLTKKPEPGVTFTILGGIGQVDFHVNVVTQGRQRTQTLIESVRRRVFAALGDHVFGEDSASLESALGEALTRRGWTAAVAESCTGGGLGQRLTNVAGSSSYFKGGVIAYADELKTSLLGVSRETLAKHGAVSLECAREMALGVRRAAAATLGLSITGVAGPGGGTAAKPVGLVYVAAAGPGETDVEALELRLGGERALVRQRSAAAALELALRVARGARS